jgi:hypothetical protein
MCLVVRGKTLVPKSRSESTGHWFLLKPSNFFLVKWLKLISFIRLELSGSITFRRFSEKTVEFLDHTFG